MRNPASSFRSLSLGVFVSLVGGALSSSACSGSSATPGDAGSPPVDPPLDAGTGEETSLDGAALDARGPVGSTKGSGGVVCASRGELSGGRAFCTLTIAGAEVKLAEPTAGAGPFRVVAYLHGDGAAAHNSGSAMRALLPFADERHALVLSVKAPNGCRWWQVPTQTDCSDTAPEVPDTDGLNADVLKAVLDAVRAAYDVTLGNAYYYGSSGGSIFLTSQFVRKYGDAYPGVYALNCGGERPTKAFAWDTTLAEKRAGTTMFFTYGDQDFLKPDIEKAAPHFAGLGFPVDTKVVAGAGHCAFDGHGRAVEVFRAN
ncbi:MAG: hypothetical protein JNM74_13820 [Myxococcales bacterium]|nr:hypothetical protein [Myxococcales bacterium]